MHELEHQDHVRAPRREDRSQPDRSHDQGPAAAGAPRSVMTPGSLLHLQRTVGNAGVVQLLADEEAAGGGGSASLVHDVVGKGGGSPLDEGTRTTMESAFGTSFGDVRVHTGGTATKSAEEVGANAYTVGNEVVLRNGLDTATPTGQRTLAHELAHVEQQRAGPVDGTDAPGGIRLSDPSDRFERAAESVADQVVGSVQTQTVSSTASTPAGGGAVAQREAEDEGGAPVLQREAMPEEEEGDEG
jgi:hypothetical protein